MKKIISSYLANLLIGCSKEEIEGILEVPPDSALGDYALPCFVLARRLHKAPALIAEELKGMVETEQKLCQQRLFFEVKAVKGYLNLYLNRAFAYGVLMEQLEGANHGIEQSGAGKTICLDYSSPNIAKNFHLGHLRTTVIGNALYQIFAKQGYQVERINHLGDWGTQFGKLIVAYKNWSCKEAVEAGGIEELERIYVRFNEESKEDSHLVEKAREWFCRLEQGDEEAYALWDWFKKISMVTYARIYNLLGMDFDSYLGESFYVKKVPALVAELNEKKILKSSEGAMIIELSDGEIPPCLITKSDGSSIYHSRDLAALLYRKKVYDFAKCIYVTGVEQSLHFKQVFMAIQRMGYDWHEDLVHVPYGLVRLDGVKLSTRNGNTLYAEELLQEAIARAEAMIEEKNPLLSDKKSVAKKVGIGAVIFHDLYNQRIKDIDFSWDSVLSFEGTTAPYVQYTIARAKRLLQKMREADKTKENVYEETAQQQAASIQYVEEMLNTCLDEGTFSLIKRLGMYPEIIDEAAMNYEPSVLARFLMQVASAFNKFYHDCPILQAEEPIKEIRLKIVFVTQMILEDGMSLLGIECPEEM